MDSDQLEHTQVVLEHGPRASSPHYSAHDNLYLLEWAEVWTISGKEPGQPGLQEISEGSKKLLFANWYVFQDI